LLAAAFAGGCDKGAQPAAQATAAPADQPAAAQGASPVLSNDHDAVVAAIQEHLRDNKGINMSVMDMTVDQVNINGDQAQAQAQFRLKQGGTTMTMTYALTRHTNGWIVSTSQPSGGQFAHPPMDKIHSGAGANPQTPPTSSTNGTAGLPDVSHFFNKR
jgi:hypothetical protein